MKSTFFHIGINRTLAKKEGLREPEVRPDGSIPFNPLPSHRDPDFDNLTYGDPWGRLPSFSPGDIAWFIESGRLTKTEWGYYVVAYYIIEDVYEKRDGSWNKSIRSSHFQRVAKNAHEIRGKSDYDIILGSKNSRKMFDNPFRLSRGQDPYPQIKTVLGMPLGKAATGYWFKKWFLDESTQNLREMIDHSELSGVH